MAKLEEVGRVRQRRDEKRSVHRTVRATSLGRRRVTAIAIAFATTLVLTGCETDSDEDVPFGDLGADASGDAAGGDAGTRDTGGEADASTDVERTDAATGDGGTDTTEDGSGAAALEIEGIWVDDFGGGHWIEGERWQMGWGPSASVFHLEPFEPMDRVVIAQNDETNAFSPGLYSRFDLVDLDEGFGFCQTVFDAESAEAASDAAPADSTDLDAGCNGFSWSILVPGQGAIAVAGSYEDGFAHQWVTSERWTLGQGPDASAFQIVEYSNAERWAIAQNDEANEFSPGAFSRFEWTWEGTTLFQCQIVFDAESEEAARSAEGADPEDIEAGCNSFSWSALAPVDSLEITGTYSESSGTEHEIGDDAWRMDFGDSGEASFVIATHSNESDFLIAQNEADNEFNPSAYSRFDWHVDESGDLWMCQTAFAAETPLAALRVEAADSVDPSTGGCGTFPWTLLEP